MQNSVFLTHEQEIFALLFKVAEISTFNDEDLKTTKACLADQIEGEWVQLQGFKQHVWKTQSQVFSSSPSSQFEAGRPLLIDTGQ